MKRWPVITSILERDEIVRQMGPDCYRVWLAFLFLAVDQPGLEVEASIREILRCVRRSEFNVMQSVKALIASGHVALVSNGGPAQSKKYRVTLK